MYFNNCRNRKHQELYGTGAFYDLDTFGRQAELAKNLRAGDTCIVVSYEDKLKSTVALTWYRFEEERLGTGENGRSCRVFFGVRKESESILKTEAAKSERYHHLFSKLGHFKQFSVIQ